MYTLVRGTMSLHFGCLWVFVFVCFFAFCLFVLLVSVCFHSDHWLFTRDIFFIMGLIINDTMPLLGLICILKCCIIYVHIYLNTMCVPDAQRQQKRTQDTLELELQTVQNCHMLPGKEHLVLLFTETSPQHLYCVFKQYNYKQNVYLCIFLFLVLDTQMCKSTFTFQRGSFVGEAQNLKMHTASPL